MIATKAYMLSLKERSVKTMSELKIKPNKVIVREVQEIKHSAIGHL